MDIHQKKTPTSLSTTTTTTLTESSDESSTNSGVFFRKETTSRNPIRALFDGLIRTSEENSKPSTSIKERHCSRCTVNENVLTGVRQTLSKELRGEPSQELADTDSIASDEDDFVKVGHPCRDIDDLENHASDEDDFVKIEQLYRDIDDLENHLMEWSEKLSLDTPEKSGSAFRMKSTSNVNYCLLAWSTKKKIPANWPSVVFKKDDKVALPYQYYAQLQLVLSDFPFYDNTIEDKFNAMHPDDHLAMKLKRRISEYLGKVSKKLNLAQCYLDAFSNNTNPVFSVLANKDQGN